MTLIKKISIAALLLLVIGTAGSLLTVKSAMTSSEVDEKKTIEDTFSKIEVKSNNSRIEMIPTEGAVATAELTGKASKGHKISLDAEVKGDTLYVELIDKQRMIFSMDFFTSIQLRVYVPKKEYDSIQLKSNNGRIMAADLDVKELGATTDNGRVELNHINGTNIQARSSNGRIELQQIDAKTVEVDTNNGSLLLDSVYGHIIGSSDNGKITMVNDHINQPMEFDTDNGRIEIETKKKPADVRFEARTSNGKITLFDQSYRKDAVVGDGKNVIKLRSQNGSITVK